VSVVAGGSAEITTLWVKTEINRDSLSVAWLKMLLPEAQVRVGTVDGYWSDLVLLAGKDYN
jgi:hypothetical protein